MAFPDVNNVTDAQASSAFQSAASANGLTVANLSAIGQLQLACANLLYGDAPVGDIPAGEIAAGTFGSSSATPAGDYGFPALFFSTTALATPTAFAATEFGAFASTVSGATLMGFGTTHDVALKNRAGTTVFGVVANSTQIDLVAAAAGVRGGATSTTFYQSNGSTVAYQYLAGSATGIGVAATANTGLGVNAAATAATGVGYGTHFSQPVTAAANSDVVEAMRVSPSFTPGAFTGLIARGVTINSFSVAGFTTPGQATMLNLGVLTATGASVGVALQISPPTGASTNYLIAHTTPATFNVLADGTITCASTINAAGGILAGSATAITAGGSLSGLEISSTANFGVFVGSGAPSISAAKGSLYLRSDGSSTTTRAYIATDGAGTWTAITTVA